MRNTIKYSPQQKDNSYFGLFTLNGHIMCAVKIKTTGLDPLTNEIVQLCVLPLDGALQPHKDFMPFNMYMRPENPEAVVWSEMQITLADFASQILTALPSDKVLDLFLTWFDKFDLRVGGLITPLGHNYNNFDRFFLQKWMGVGTYSTVFNYDVRDTYTLIKFINDRDVYCNKFATYTSYSLRSACTKHEIDTSLPKDAFTDCLLVSKLYHKLCSDLTVGRT